MITRLDRFLRGRRMQQSCCVTSSAFSIKGAHRKRNEDDWRINTEQTLFIVADGLGGYPAGDIASELSTEFISEYVASRQLNCVPIETAEQATEVLNAAFQFASSRVASYGALNECQGMGAAAITALHSGKRIFITGLGDCRAYLNRNHKLTRLTVDDTIPDRLRADGRMSECEASVHPYRNMVTKCIGARHFESANDACVVDLRDNDRILLCSDGLYNSMSESEILHFLDESNSADEAVRLLEQSAISIPATDDATAIVIFPVTASPDRKRNGV